jgi:hypothetical protein
VDCRAGTVISETWEDGQVLKDLNAHLVCSFYIYIYIYFGLLKIILLVLNFLDMPVVFGPNISHSPYVRV